MTHPNSRKKSLFCVVAISYEFVQCDYKYKHEGPPLNLMELKQIIRKWRDERYMLNDTCTVWKWILKYLHNPEIFIILLLMRGKRWHNLQILLWYSLWSVITPSLQMSFRITAETNSTKNFLKTSFPKVLSGKMMSNLFLSVLWDKTLDKEPSSVKTFLVEKRHKEYKWYSLHN